MSKNFTALAIMFSVQDGLIDLDIPITKYLTSFRVNSCYEDSPENKITLRMMLSHTAGFTHEAPIGNNYDFRCNSEQEHWNSINNTWLKFSAGTQYSYSNLGFDLAAEIIEKVSGISFEAYMEEKIFIPLEMKNSTASDNDFLLNKNRTEGIISFAIKQKHYKIPLIGSGSVYSNINEMVKYIQFQMNFGMVNNNQIMQNKDLTEMYTINKNNYGLGTNVVSCNDVESFFLNHNGGGFGYGSSMTWFPEYGLGCIILGNKTFNYSSITYGILHDFITQNSKVKKDTALTHGFFPDFIADKQQTIFNSCENINTKGNLIVGKYEVLYDCVDYKWYANIMRFLGYKFQKITISQNEDGVLIMNGDFGTSELKEYIPGLFFTSDGEAFDIRGEMPAFRNIILRKYSKL